MGTSEPTFALLLDHLAGREDAAAVRYLEENPESLETATRLLGAMRRAGAAPALTGKLRRRAARIFREHHRPARVGLLQLVFDSWRSPAPALRGREDASRRSSRFLRMESGPITLELQITLRRGRAELRGQFTPASAAFEVRARDRVVRVEPDGTFLFPSLARGDMELEINGEAVATLKI